MYECYACLFLAFLLGRLNYFKRWSTLPDHFPGSPLKELSFELFPDRGVERLLALYRFKPCWTVPKVLQKLSELPQAMPTQTGARASDAKSGGDNRTCFSYLR